MPRLRISQIPILCKCIPTIISNLWWQRGRILNSLKYQIEKQLRESIYTNKTFKLIKWNHYERRFLYFSKKTNLSVIVNLSVWFLFVTLLSFGLPHLKNLFPMYKITTANLSEWLTVLLQCQITILGLIFPLVIALIGINLQSRTANKALWEIYKNYSSLYYLGISGLLLVAAMVSLQFVRPFLGSDFNISLTVGLIVWFIYNIEILGWFLFVTVEFVSIVKRSQLLLRYSINEIFLDDIRLRLSTILPQHAVHYGLIDGLDHIDAFNRGITNNEPLINTFGFNNKKDKYHFEIITKKTRYLNNIYFRVLNYGVSYWKNLITKQNKSDTHKISLPIRGWSQGSEKWLISSCTSQPFDNSIKFLLRISYSFRKSPYIDTSSFNQILNALVANIEDALKDNNLRLFNEALEEMRVWHVQIAESLAFINDDKQWDNWMLLKDGSFFGRSYLDELQREYWKITHTSLRKLTESKEYYEEFCYFFLQIYGFQNEKLAIPVRTALISSHESIWSILMNWYTDKKIEGQNYLIEKHYRGVIRTFAGSWENWSHRLCPNVDDEIISQETIKCLAYHLQKTSEIVFEAILNKEEYAVKTSVDLLLNWHANFFWMKVANHYIENQSLLTHILLDQQQNSPIWNAIKPIRQLKQNDYASVAMKNVWIDTRMVTACYIINETLTDQDSSLDAYATALISGKSFESTGSLRSVPECITKGSDVLFAYLRHRWFYENDKNSYDSWIDNVVSAFQNSKPSPPRIDGRIHSEDVGIRSVSSLKNVYILLAIVNSRNEWELSEKFISNVLIDIITYEAHKRLLHELNKWTSPDIEIIKKALSILGEGKLDTHLQNYLESIDKFNAVVTTLVKDKVVNAGIDLDKLISINQQASKDGFRLDNDYIPTSLFNSLKFIEDIDDAIDFCFGIGGYRKETIAEGVLSDSNAHLDNSYSKYIAEDVRTRLYRLFLMEMEFKERTFENPPEIIAAILKDSNEMLNSGLTPICFVGSEKILDLLSDNIWKIAQDDDCLQYNIRKKDDFNMNDYKCHIEDIEVYRLPFIDTDYCLLSAKECFDELCLRENIKDRYVYAGFVHSKEDKTKGALRLCYWMNATFKDLPSYKYLLMDNN